MSSRLKIALLIIGLLSIVGVGIYFYIRPSGEASGLQSTDRISLFVYPQKVAANNSDKAKIIAIVKRKQQPLGNVNIFFSSNLGTLSSQQVTTDSDGEAVTYLKSDTIGSAVVTAVVGEATKDIKVDFIGSR